MHDGIYTYLQIIYLLQTALLQNTALSLDPIVSFVLWVIKNFIAQVIICVSVFCIKDINFLVQLVDFF